MSIAQKALENLATQSMHTVTAFAVDCQFFTRSTVYRFRDDSMLTINMYGKSYAT